MTLTAAPYYADVCHDGDEGTAYWSTTSDGKRIRLAVWANDADRGTVLLFPGRTEYVEKYAASAADLEQRGYCTIAIDWRGQGLADRLVDDPMLGHVDKFSDYQLDVASMLSAAETLNLPKPYYLVAHSMGGAIGLRSLMESLPVKAAVFSAPMWNIHLAPHMRPIAWIMSHIMPVLGLGAKNPPGTTLDSYVMSAPFEDNMLTTDRLMYEMMQKQVRVYPTLGLGGPSYVWLRESLCETSKAAAQPAPSTPVLTFLGTNERIVDVKSIHKRMGTWSNGTLAVVEGAEHEIMMDKPEIRKDAFDQMAALFARNT